MSVAGATRDTEISDIGDRVLVIGAGLAGLSLALRLKPRGAVLITPALQPGPSGGAASAWAQGGVAAALGPDDSPEDHAADTIAAGDGLTDPDIALLLAREGPARVRELADLGAPFDRDQRGGFVLSREAAHSRARVARVKGDLAGREIMRTLGVHVRSADHVEIRFGLTARALLRDHSGAVCGALVADASGALSEIRARDVVLATGGVGGLYAVTTNPPGAVIADPEFIQFHPTAIDVGADPAPLATEALRGEGAIIVDAAGAPIVDPLAPRDIVARAVDLAKQQGRSPRLDARVIGAHFESAFPTVFASCRRHGVDPRLEPIPIAPAAHYHMGGAATDDRGRTTAVNLWALGEAASTGAHGANRLASNSLLEAIVLAARAADALNDAVGAASAPMPTPAPPLLDEARISALRALMARAGGVVRSGDALAAALSILDEQRAEAGDANPLVVARMILTAARDRTESRGAHFRADHPEPSPEPRRTFLLLCDDAIETADTPSFIRTRLKQATES